MGKKKQKLLFSIITVSFNQPKLINNLKSLKNQTYKNFEHIIIDGGSTDKTIDIIKKNSKYISFWQSKKDKGIYDAMNIGIKKKGFTQKEIERINGPVGLNIFPKKPSEIAISIIAQIIQLKNNL